MVKKAVEMGRYYTSEALRDPKLQKKAIDYVLDKFRPSLQNVGSQALDRLSTKIRPKKKYKTNTPSLDGGALDIQKHLSKLGELHLRTPTGKKYNYCGPGTKLEEGLNSDDPKYREPINKLDSICQQPDTAYSKAGEGPSALSKKHEADDAMIKAIGNIPFSQSPRFPTPVKYTMQAKKSLGLGVKPNQVKSRLIGAP